MPLFYQGGTCEHLRIFIDNVLLKIYVHVQKLITMNIYIREGGEV